MEDFASYILNEQDYIQKMVIAYYMSQKVGTYFDKSIVLRTEITRMFLNYAELDVDENKILTATLLCNCKKIDNAQKLGKLETYAKEGAEYLATLGFDEDFCNICEGLNRYSGIKKRKKESDILELVDQFTGLILKRAERDAFTPEEALIILKERNLKNVNNRYLEDFILFVKAMENVYIHDTVDVPVIRKLSFLTEREPDVKSFISKLGNRYSQEIDKLIKTNIKKDIKDLLYNSKEKKNNMIMEKAEGTKNKLYTVHRYTRKIRRKNTERALFSQEVADRIMNHDTSFKFE